MIQIVSISLDCVAIALHVTIRVVQWMGFLVLHTVQAFQLLRQATAIGHLAAVESVQTGTRQFSGRIPVSNSKYKMFTTSSRPQSKTLRPG